MTISVDWTDEAVFSLASIWLRAPDRQAVTAAQAQIDRWLKTDPMAHAVHVSEGLYTIDMPPLRAQFEISTDQRTVTVVSVRECP